MLSAITVIASGLGWLLLMFAVALYAERRPQAFARHWRHVYALSLAVYCTSWTFFGIVTQAAGYGWPLPPTFVGTLLLYAFAAVALVRLVRLSRASNATSIADLIATRLGKDPWLAATVTLVAALGLIPYIALQLRAVSSGFGLLVGDVAQSTGWGDSTLLIALAMAAFAIAFGARHANAAEHNRGLVLAMAFDSLFKLVAMLALGVFVWWTLGDAMPRRPPPPPAADGFVPLVVLGALAMFTLPHQFHMGVVECRDASHVRTARWLFPLYLVLIALPVLPLARIGQAVLGETVPSDSYVLALPLLQGHGGMALWAFLGGLSAATGMVVVSTLTLSLMIGNHWLLPWLSREWGRAGQSDLRGTVLRLRRLGIVTIMLLAWAFSRSIAGSSTLADVGALSFSALATLAPALAFAVWRPRTPPLAVTLGIVAGFLAWIWALPLPLMLEATPVAPAWLREGPLGIAWLAPDGLFALIGWSRLGRAVTASLLIGAVVTWLLAAWRRPAARRARRGLSVQVLRPLAQRFLPPSRVDALLTRLPGGAIVPGTVEDEVEHELAAVIGAASARVLLNAARRETGRDLDTVADIVDETAEDLRFNQRVLEAALENMSQGISVVDADLRLVAWNRRYAEMFGFPPGLLKVGLPIAEASRFALARMPERHDIEAGLQRRLAHMRTGTPHLSERVLPDGSIIEIRGNPMPGSGFVATFTDVTAFRQAESKLKSVNEMLEQRVGERTALLEGAKREAERASEAKSRFLAAIGHDLLQPLHAAHLFAAALRRRVRAEESRRLAEQLTGALDSTTALITDLLDMSRLEAGGLVAEPRAFALREVLEPLLSEGRAMAAERGLRLRFVASSAWVRGDPQLLRRVVQNFLSNALRHTARGRVLVGVRRAGRRLRIEVHDTGPGIAEAQRALIFEEFRRGEHASGQGLGLGLAIARGIAEVLRAPIGLRSRVGRGSVFDIELPRATPSKTSRQGGGRLAGLRVLAVDNDCAALDALATVLRGWRCEVAACGDGVSALAALQEEAADLWLFDHHLDDGDDGIALYRRLSQYFVPPPTLLLSADRTGAVRAAAQEVGLPLLMKPVRALALKSMLDRLLAARGAP
ncbi:response regulator [Lysobacter pythonis]|uniref:histidine kinase n=1 Tax=Solilutibacter pythonis TaxID=2483112 RepID=A0A3M2I2V1_9GAMM|nr:PAS-domain containing protein [Lysobacter pythonis]RMH94473.1 response regulator [Lysobacter pythonis]